MAKKERYTFVPARVTNTTCEAASALCKEVGSRIFWRPDGVINWTLPGYDLAQVLED